MSCRKAFDVDIAGFLAEAGRPEFAEFREHYPLCAECAAEVRAWTDLHVLLQSGAAARTGAHPEPASLLQYAQRDGALDAVRRSELERHLAACASCRDELTALRRFDFAGLPGARPAAPATGRRLREVLAAVRGFVTHPAFAYALVALLLYPAITGVLERSRLPGLARVAGESAPPMERALEAEAEEANERLEAEEPAPEAFAHLEALRVREAPSEPARPAAQPALEALDAPGDSTRHLGYVQEKAAAPREARAPGPAPSASGLARAAAKRADPRLEIGPRGPVLYVPIPEALRGAPGVEVRVRLGGGRRELRSRFAGSELGAEVPIPLPPDYAAAGPAGAEVYDVEVLALPAGSAGATGPR